MNAAALLALIAEIYGQMIAVRAENEQLTQKLATTTEALTQRSDGLNEALIRIASLEQELEAMVDADRDER
jgi:hypothetical protein